MSALSPEAVIGALRLPPSARVDQRVPKKLFIEQGAAPTGADKRLIQDGIEEVRWIAALKPDTMGVAAYADDARQYLEIAVLTAALRDKAKSARLLELIHRAIPYPLILVAQQDDITTVSGVHKRLSLGETDKTVLEGEMVVVELRAAGEIATAFADSLALASMPSRNLYDLYGGWIDRLHALAAARLTGRYVLTHSAAAAADRRAALDDHTRLTREIAGLRTKAAKETQMNRRVDLNLAIKRLEAELAAATAKL